MVAFCSLLFFLLCVSLRRHFISISTGMKFQTYTLCDSQACSLFQIGCTRKREGKAKVVVVVVLLLETEKVVREPSSSVIYRYRTIAYHTSLTIDYGSPLGASKVVQRKGTFVCGEEWEGTGAHHW